MSALSTANRYRAENGPVVFGVPGVSIRWNRVTACCVIEIDGANDARMAFSGETGEMVLLALAAAHRQGKMQATLRNLLEPVHQASAWQDEWYRCGKMMLRRAA